MRVDAVGVVGSGALCRGSFHAPLSLSLFLSLSHTHTHTHTHLRTHTHAHAHTHARTHTHTHGATARGKLLEPRGGADMEVMCAQSRLEVSRVRVQACLFDSVVAVSVSVQVCLRPSVSAFPSARG